MTVRLVEEKSRCSGCMACLDACPCRAITAKEDENGFVYPEVSSSLCVECGRCLSACPFKNDLCAESLQETYAAAALYEDLSESSSGALFPAIASAWIKDGGAVYGCSMTYENEEITIRHIRASSLQELKLLKGSKYVQSITEGIYRKVKEDLNNGIPVLFSGTPCQIAGLNGYLGKAEYGLYTIDIVCHGVPSQSFFHSYIAFEEGVYKAKLRNFVFRDKSEGWKLHGRMETADGKTIFFEPEDSSYYQLFLNRYTYRDSCYQCPYASRHRPADITLADYWNIDLVHPEMLKENGGVFDEKKGISALVINNSRGQELISRYKDRIQMELSTYENASRYNKQFIRPSIQPDDRSEVFENYKKGYEAVDQTYKAKLRIKKAKRRLKALVPKTIKRAVRKLKD